MMLLFALHHRGLGGYPGEVDMADIPGRFKKDDITDKLEICQSASFRSIWTRNAHQQLVDLC